MRKCNEINELMSLYIDNLLDDSTRAEFEEHINTCASCREELDGLKKVIELCRNVDEVELPEGFREELHQKLVAEKEKLYKSKGTNLLGKYIRICSTIAACLLISFFAGRFIADNYFLPAKHDNMTKSAEIYNVQQEAAAGAGTSEAQEAEGFTSADEDSAMFSISADSGYKLGGEDMPGTSRHTDTNERSFGLMTTNIRPLNNKNINIEFKVSDGANAQAQIDRIKEFALNNGAEISDYLSPCFTEESEYGKEKESINFTGKTNAAQPKPNVLYLKVYDENYAKFLDLLKSRFSDLNMEIGKLETKDCTEILNDLRAQLQDLDERIEEVEKNKSVSDPDELTRLKKERENVWVEMERLQLDSNYTFITVELRTE